MRPVLRSINAIWLCLILTSCQTTASVATDTAASIPCAALVPIYWSKDDTRKTQDQVTEYNAVWKAICQTQP